MRSLPTSVTDPNGTVTTSAYDTSGRVTQTGIANTANLLYTYTNGNLSAIQRTNSSGASQTYNFTYDSFGNMLSVKVGSRNLAANIYANGNGQLTKQTYGNGATVNYTYDILGRIKTATYSDGRKLTYAYNGEGQLHSLTETGGGEVVTYVYTYDSIGRLINSQQLNGENTVLRTSQSYNSSNQLTKQSWQVGGDSYSEDLTYNSSDGSLNTFSIARNGTALTTFTMGYDGLRRLTSMSSGVFTRNYTYRDISDSKTTTQVKSVDYYRTSYGSTYKSNGYAYIYDNAGNILTSTDKLNNVTSYTYDDQNQLLTESGTVTSFNGPPVSYNNTYTYDTTGNILTSSDGETTHTYTYGDAEWKDLLTAYDGESITYDAIGNPLSDGTWTYTWQNGRQLQKMQKLGVTAEFVYNADGLRVQKTVNGVVTKYTLHGKNVVHMTSGADELHFFYDAQNRPAVVLYNGTAYAYVKNLQGDVIALLDGTGNVVVSYVYDAWGAPIGKSGSMAETLGSVQPFRYRGYVFDEETGLYYLRSRYYNPGWRRFVNADVLIGAGKLLSHNLFAYCDNVPVSFSDKHGQTRENSFFYETTIEDVAGNCACQTIPEIIFRNYIGEWPSPETVNKKGKVHVIVNYLDFCNDELVTVISDEDLLTLSRMLAYEIDKRYGINFDSIDIKQMKGEIALHMYGYIWFGLKNCYDIDLDIYCDGSVRDSRWRVNFAASLFKN